MAAANGQSDPLQDPLAALPEQELRSRVLMHLPRAEQQRVALVCRAWRDAVTQLPFSGVRLTAEQVQSFNVAAAEGCVADAPAAAAAARRLLTHVERYHDLVSHQVDAIVGELPAALKQLSCGTPASVAACCWSLQRLSALQSLTVAAGFYQELRGLPSTLQMLRLCRNVVYVRLTGDLSNLRNLEIPVYEQSQLQAVTALPALQHLRLHLYAGVGLSLSALRHLASEPQRLELRVYGAALTDVTAVAEVGSLQALSLHVDLSFYSPGAASQETALLAALKMPPQLQELHIMSFCASRPLPRQLVSRLEVLRPQLTRVFLAPLPAGWVNTDTAGSEFDAWELLWHLPLAASSRCT